MTKNQFYNKWGMSEPVACSYRKKIKQEFGFCEYKHMDIFLEDRLNIKKLAQELMIDKSAIDIIDLFDNNYMRAYRYVISLFSDRNIITNYIYDKSMEIIYKFENKRNNDNITNNLIGDLE